jgi:hypothetical protein
MPIYDYKLLLDADFKAMAAGNTNSQNEINFGIAEPDVGKGGKFGVHVVITQAYTAVNSGAIIWVLHGAATSPDTKLIGRFLSQTQLGVLGAHYFMPCPPGTLLQYARLKHQIVSENATLGQMTTWFGPDSDGGI